jgi:acetyl esterase/lipase
MEILKVIIQILAATAGSLVALMSIPVFLRFRWPAPVLWSLKLFISAISPVLGFVGVLTIIAGFATDSTLILLIGLYDVLFFFIHIFRITDPKDIENEFNGTFGFNWEAKIHPNQKKYFLLKNTILELPEVPASRFDQNIPFAIVPDTGRELKCDIWQPAGNIPHSGLAFIYLHGSAWYFLDKDCGTRPFFSHLTAQGHVVMDVDYRLFPETDMMGMLHDVKRAILWMKENAMVYGVNPDRIVVGGGSAGGHLALLAAYTANNPQFTPPELVGEDIGVRAVISIYGQADMKACYYHLNQHLTTRSIPGRPKKAVPTQFPEWIKKRMGSAYYRLRMNKGFVNAGNVPAILGGHPDECPETYALFSPVMHVHPGCPPTLLIHGQHDIMAPVKAIRILHQKLLEKKIKTVIHILPQTDHAFDLVLPKISPSAHTAIYDVERFLALQTKVFEKVEMIPEEIKEYQLNFS